MSRRFITRKYHAGQGVLELLLSEMATARAAAGMAGVAGAGAQQVRRVIESRWSQPASACRRL
eukprot:COSAG01_NODE_4956_length_4590_cov_7.535070_4_plen_63_part_00